MFQFGVVFLYSVCGIVLLWENWRVDISRLISDILEIVDTVYVD